ncbi:MAG: hypothetical protein ACE5F1_21370 [Planctomycetota bacterium]
MKLLQLLSASILLWAIAQALHASSPAAPAVEEGAVVLHVEGMT